MANWRLVDNPDWAGRTPTIQQALCHDRSPFITVLCPACGIEGHIHESQIRNAPADVEFGFRCSECRTISIVPAGFFQGAFRQMRDDGWIE